MSYPQTSFQCTKFDQDGFWGQKRQSISKVALLYQLDVLKSTGRYDAFKLKWHPIYDDPPEIWPVPKHLFWDSDVAKWIEGACYFLHESEDATVRSAVDELVAMISSAQQPDGYLNIHFTVVEPTKRFTNLRDLHELYNAGHLIEAALAHEKLTKSDALLKAISQYVSLLSRTFGPDSSQTHGYPGHPEIELALLRMYARTGEQSQLDLAQYFLTERGKSDSVNGQHYYDAEAVSRGEGQHEIPDYYPARRSYWYQQAHLPIIEQPTIEGHSVRAMYLLTAVADLVRMQGSKADPAYVQSLHRLWNNMVNKKMYVTGGIGSMKQWEGFGEDYFLPQSTDEGGCYAETCAAIGIMMLADRMLEIERDGKYGDIMELCLFNAVLTGVSCDGRSWTYVNQMASSDADPSARSDWFTVACCPPNVLRLLGCIGGYLYQCNAAEDGKSVEITITLFAAADILIPTTSGDIKISMKTNWPLDGRVQFDVQLPKDIDVSVKLRIPQWADKDWQLAPASPIAERVRGYISLDSSYLRKNNSFELDLPMKPFWVRPHRYTNQPIVSIQRGPVVYCAEDVDNNWAQDHFRDVMITNTTEQALKEMEKVDAKTGENYVEVTASGSAIQLKPEQLDGHGPGIAIGSAKNEGDEARDLVLVPYYFRSNRGGRGQMRTGFRTTSC